MNRKLKPITDDIFSQMPEQDDSYVVDSFCVSDNYMTQKVAKKKVKKSFRRLNVDYNDSLMVELVEQTNHEIEISRKKGFSKARNDI